MGRSGRDGQAGGITLAPASPELWARDREALRPAAPTLSLRAADPVPSVFNHNTICFSACLWPRPVSLSGSLAWRMPCCTACWSPWTLHAWYSMSGLRDVECAMGPEKQVKCVLKQMLLMEEKPYRSIGRLC